MTPPTISFTLGRRLGMVVYITEKSMWAGPTLSHVAFACSYILCVKKKILLDVEKSLWAGPTRGLWFFVRGACGRDPPGGGKRLKKKDLVGDTLVPPVPR